MKLNLAPDLARGAHDFMLRKAGISGRSLDLVSRDDSFTEQVLWGSVLSHMLEVRDAHTAPQVAWGRDPGLSHTNCRATG